VLDGYHVQRFHSAADCFCVSAESGRALRVTMPIATPIAVRVVAEHEERQFGTATEESSSPEHLELFLLHSILRR
jgi:hypothetical protein